MLCKARVHVAVHHPHHHHQEKQEQWREEERMRQSAQGLVPGCPLYLPTPSSSRQTARLSEMLLTSSTSILRF